MNKVLTISVAAYNLGDMLVDNIESFIKAKHAEKVELLIINDGSKDNTREVAEKYQAMYPKTVKVINKENGGAGSTVNEGIKRATGKFFKMVDGDDWVDSENLDILIEKLEETDADMILTNFDFYNEKKKTVVRTMKIEGMVDSELISIEDFDLNTDYRMHNITYKTSILQNNSITVDNGFYTDTQYVNYPLPFIKTVEYFDLIIYKYRIGQSEQSVSIPKMQKNIEYHLLITNHLVQYYENNKNSEKNMTEIMKKNITSVVINHIEILLTFKMNKVNKEKIKTYIRTLKENSRDIYDETIKAKKVKLLVSTKYLLIKPVSKMVKNILEKRSEID